MDILSMSDNSASQAEDGAMKTIDFVVALSNFAQSGRNDVEAPQQDLQKAGIAVEKAVKW